MAPAQKLGHKVLHKGGKRGQKEGREKGIPPTGVKKRYLLKFLKARSNNQKNVQKLLFKGGLKVVIRYSGNNIFSEQKSEIPTSFFNKSKFVDIFCNVVSEQGLGRG